MEQKEYINPFSKTSELYAQNLDDASLSGDIVSLEHFLSEIEKILLDEDMASQARLYYSIGTVYSDLVKAKRITYEESVKKQLYCFRCICQPKTEPLHQFKNEPPTNDIKYGRWLICLVVNF